MLRRPKNTFIVQVPLEVREEIYRADEEINDRGVSVDDIDCVDDFPPVQR
jgi:hypothetical protein